MNIKGIFKVLGVLLLIEAALMIPPIGIAFLYGETDWIYFLYTLAGSAIVGGTLFLITYKSKKTIHAADGYVVVALAWIVMSAVAAVPFVISGYVPSFLDAMFETVSGFSTTGASAMDDVEILTHCMQFWRIFTNWLGGMGILVFMLAISPVTGGGTAIHILRAESPGPTTEKISPKISTTAKYLYLIYLGMTVLQIICLMISGLNLFNSTMVSFATMATGGFSYLNSSMMAFTSAQQTITTIFMVLAGVNFSLFFLILTGKIKDALKNEELRWYLIIFVGSCVVLTLSVYLNGCFSGVGESIHHVAFSMASVITTTGFSSCDMNVWPWFAKTLCMVIMFFGGCAGSTAGGIKVSRIGIALKTVHNELRRLMHPRSVSTVRYSDKEVPNVVSSGIMFFFVIYIIIFAASFVIVSLDPKVDFEGAFSAVDTTLNNNGVSFGTAYGSFSGFQWYSKVVFIIDMLIGRLEVFPILILLDSILSPARNAGRRIARGFKRGRRA